MRDDLVLVVDDNESNRKLIRFLLASKGWSVTCAASADEALEVLENDVPRLILMDIQMPGTDGLTLTRQLREDARFDETVIVAVTAFAMKTDEQRVYEAGCDGYIAKPIDTRGFPDEVASFLTSERRSSK